MREARSDAPRGGGRGGGDGGFSRGRGVTTVILEAVMVTVSPLRKQAFQSLSMRNVVYMAVLVVVVVDVVKLVTVNVLEGHSSVIVELAESLS